MIKKKTKITTVVANAAHCRQGKRTLLLFLSGQDHTKESWHQECSLHRLPGKSKSFLLYLKTPSASPFISPEIPEMPTNNCSSSTTTNHSSLLSVSPSPSLWLPDDAPLFQNQYNADAIIIINHALALTQFLPRGEGRMK